ncbi:MAG: CpsD/CapB family tyrosine-protein kinase [Clostridia bacterium]|nr:CpsD/CapB family tyrosine-protein kinase [Clostridia bacterium]
MNKRNNTAMPGDSIAPGIDNVAKELTDFESQTQLTQSKSVPFAVVEAYKTIRTNLMFMLPQKGNKCIVFSSAMPSEGKSTSSVNVAIAFSQLGHKTLVIDCDLRKPSLHKKLRVSNTKGLSSVLVGFSDVSETVTNINPCLDVLTAGPTPPNPSELLGSDNLGSLLEILKQYYEYIIIDSPPINVVTDTLVIAPRTDGMVMVVKDHTTTHDQLKRAFSAIELAGIHLLGAIMNGSESNYKKKYYNNKKGYKSYGYY